MSSTTAKNRRNNKKAVNHKRMILSGILCLSISLLSACAMTDSRNGDSEPGFAESGTAPSGAGNEMTSDDKASGIDQETEADSIPGSSGEDDIQGTDMESDTGNEAGNGTGNEAGNEAGNGTENEAGNGTGNEAGNETGNEAGDGTGNETETSRESVTAQYRETVTASDAGIVFSLIGLFGDDTPELVAGNRGEDRYSIYTINDGTVFCLVDSLTAPELTYFENSGVIAVFERWNGGGDEGGYGRSYYQVSADRTLTNEDIPLLSYRYNAVLDEQGVYTGEGITDYYYMGQEIDEAKYNEVLETLGIVEDHERLCLEGAISAEEMLNMLK